MSSGNAVIGGGSPGGPCAADAAARVELALALAKDRLAALLVDAAAVPGATYLVGSVP